MVNAKRTCKKGMIYKTGSGKPLSDKIKTGQLRHCPVLSAGGERGIRTPGSFHFNGFQDRRIRPLCHLSAAKIHSQIIPPKFSAKRKKKGG